MFEITDAEKLRDAYTLLAFIRDDVPATTAEQKTGLAAFMVSIKKEIRAYNNRPAPDSRIVEERGIDGYIELVQLPDELDKVNEDDATEWFRANRYYEFYPTAYDCSGQRFTNWYKLHRRCGCRAVPYGVYQTKKGDYVPFDENLTTAELKKLFEL